MNIYNINFSPKRPILSGNWLSEDWKNGEIAQLSFLRPESADISSEIKVKLLYNDEGISGIFNVEDSYVICRNAKHMEPVWNDSCVEFFVKPYPDKGYFNFEFNCLGALYASYIINPERTENGFKDFVLFKMEDCKKVEIAASLKGPIEEEIIEPVSWFLQFFIPFSLMEQFIGKIDLERDNQWSCNFYKCADKSSHPHWISWSKVNELNFHAPESFGKLQFRKK